MLDLTELIKSAGAPVVQKLIRFCEDESTRSEGVESERFRVLKDELKLAHEAEEIRDRAKRTERDKLERLSRSRGKGD